MQSVLAIDSGTTGATCLVIAADGRVLGRGYREIPQHYPEPGWVEHEPLEILNLHARCGARGAVARGTVADDDRHHESARDARALESSARERRSDRAIVWQDRRTAARCAELAPQADDIAERTGLLPDPYFSATKLEWLLAHDEIRRMADDGTLAAGTIDSWLIWHLTGGAVHATDPTNASRTMLYDIRSLDVERRSCCALFGVPRAMLPEVRASSGDFGVARGALLGLTRDIPIHGVAGDQQAALFGQGCWDAGQGKNTYGTGAFLLLNTGDASAARPAAACSRPSRAMRTVRRRTRSKARSSSPAPRCSGCATDSASSRRRRRRRRSRAAIDVERRRVLRSGAHGTRRAALGAGCARHDRRASRAARRARTSRAPRSRRWRTRTADVLEVMRSASGAAVRPAARGWRRDGERLADAISGRRARRSGRAAGHGRRRRRSARPGSRGSLPACGPTHRHSSARARFQSFSPGANAAAARASREGWARAVRAALSWARDAHMSRSTLARKLDAHCAALDACRAVRARGSGRRADPVARALAEGDARGSGAGSGRRRAQSERRAFAGRAGKTMFRWLDANRRRRGDVSRARLHRGGHALLPRAEPVAGAATAFRRDSSRSSVPHGSRQSSESFGRSC